MEEGPAPVLTCARECSPPKPFEVDPRNKKESLISRAKTAGWNVGRYKISQSRDEFCCSPMYFVKHIHICDFPVIWSPWCADISPQDISPPDISPQDNSPPNFSPPDISHLIVHTFCLVIIVSCNTVSQTLSARSLNICSVSFNSQLCRAPRARYSSPIVLTKAAVSQSAFPEFLFLNKSDTIILPVNVFEQFFFKQLGISSIKELIDNID